jgi:hypothetical protein
MGKRGYVKPVDIPNGGAVIFADTSGFKHGGVYGNHMQDAVMGIRRMHEYHDMMKGHGKVVTVPGVLVEMRENVEFWEVERYRLRQFIESGILNRADSRTRRKKKNKKLRQLDRDLIMYNGIIQMLSENIGLNFSGSRAIPYKEVRGFADKFKPSGRRAPLSEVDKEVAIGAFMFGPCGLFSADRSQIELFSAGVKNFGLDGYFLCDALKSRVKNL